MHKRIPTAVALGLVLTLTACSDSPAGPDKAGTEGTRGQFTMDVTGAIQRRIRIDAPLPTKFDFVDEAAALVYPNLTTHVIINAEDFPDDKRPINDDVEIVVPDAIGTYAATASSPQGSDYPASISLSFGNTYEGEYEGGHIWVEGESVSELRGTVVVESRSPDRIKGRFSFVASSGYTGPRINGSGTFDVPRVLKSKS